jgi:hypothetical protein
VNSGQAFTERAKCPSCGLWVLRNGKTLTISHEFPECPWFSSAVAESKERTDELELVDLETGQTLGADPTCAVCRAPYSEHGSTRPHDNPARGCRSFTYGEPKH